MARRLEALSPIKLDERQIQKVLAEAETYKKAMRQVNDAFGVLWNAQFDVAVATGRADLIDDILGNPVGFLDNCDCNSCGGGGGGGAGAW